MKKKVTLRGSTSIFLVGTALLELITGIVLYIAPPGRIAHWTNWKMLGLLKEEWQAFHVVAGFFMIIAAGIHIYYNWKVFLNYLKEKGGALFSRRGDLLAALLLLVILWAGSVYSIPPIIYIADLGEYATDSWEEKETAPPIPHAELMTVAEIAAKLSLTPEQALEKLKRKGITATPAQTLEEVGKNNGKTPQEIYQILATKGQSDGEFAGSGIGRIPLSEAALQFDIPLETILQRLADAGITATAESTIRDISEETGKSPADLLTIIQGK